MVSQLFDPARWRQVPGFDLSDVTYHRAVDQGTVRIAFARPEVRNAFRPKTVDELDRVLDHARRSTDVGCQKAEGSNGSGSGLLMRRSSTRCTVVVVGSKVMMPSNTACPRSAS